MQSKGYAQSANDTALQRIVSSENVRQRFGSASDQAISEYEAKYNTRFSDQYRAFLRRENGLRFSFTSDAAEKFGVSPVLADMNTFFGVGNGDLHNDLLLLTPNMGFYNKSFLPYGALIGVGGDWCTYVEICQGKFSGQIMYTDGEMYRDPGIRNMPVDGLSADSFVEQAIEKGWFMPVASSFDALLADYAKMA